MEIYYTVIILINILSIAYCFTNTKRIFKEHFELMDLISNAAHDIGELYSKEKNDDYNQGVFDAHEIIATRYLDYLRKKNGKNEKNK